MSMATTVTRAGIGTPSDAPPTTGAARLPRAERREQVLRAAAGAFRAAGFDGTSMEDVAREAGVTRLIVYRIFESKEALYAAVLDQVVDDLRETVDVEGRTGVVSGLVTVARRHPDAFRLLWRHAAHEPAFASRAEEVRRAVDEIARTLIADAVTDPLLQAWAASAIVAFVHEGICGWLDVGDPARDDVLVAYLVGGVRAMIDRWSATG